MSAFDPNRFRTGGALQGKLASSLLVAAEPSFAPGALLGVWQVERLLGRGGMSEVYLARRASASFEQTVALKIVSARPEFNERLREERRMLSRLKHPGIAGLIDGGELPDGRVWFAMEYVEGVRLDEFLKTRKVSWPALIELFEALCSAVMHAHAHLLVHRDIKPANVMVDDQGRLRLLDFGIAVPATERCDGIDRYMTPGFAAPEQLAGGDITTATDIYQVGESLLRLTFESSDFDASPLIPPVRKGLQAIIARATARDPADRYDSVARLREDLEALRLFHPVRAAQGGLAYRAHLFIRRHPSSAGLVVGLCTIALISAMSLIQSLNREAEERRMALREEHTANAIGNFFVDLFHDPSTASSEGGVAGMLDRGQQRLLANKREAPETRAALLHALAMANARMDRGSTARPLLTEAVAVQRSLGKTATAELALSLAALAQIEYLEGNTEVAFTHASESQALLDGPSVPESHNRFLALAQLGELHSVALSFQAADTLLERALELGQRRYGVDSPQLFDLRRLQTDSLRNQWQVARVLPLSEAFLAACESNLGSEDPSCIVERIHLARTLSYSGQLVRAEHILRTLLSSSDSWTGSYRIYRTHAVLFNLAENLWLQGRYPEARHSLQRSLDIFVEAGADSGPHWNSDRSTLAMFLIDMGEPEEGLAIMNSRPLRTPGKLVLTEDHFLVVRHAQAEIAVGRVDASTKPAVAEAVEALSRIFGPSSHFAGQARLVHAQLAFLAGDLPLAKGLLDQAERADPQGLKLHHPHLLSCIDMLRAEIAERSGQPVDAQAWRERAVAHLPADLFPDDHPIRVAILKRMGRG